MALTETTSPRAKSMFVRFPPAIDFHPSCSRPTDDAYRKCQSIWKREECQVVTQSHGRNATEPLHASDQQHCDRSGEMQPRKHHKQRQKAKYGSNNQFCSQRQSVVSLTKSVIQSCWWRFSCRHYHLAWLWIVLF